MVESGDVFFCERNIGGFDNLRKTKRVLDNGVFIVFVIKADDNNTR